MADRQDIDQLRARLDEINASLVSLLNERGAIALEIGRGKQPGSKYVPEREAKIIDDLLADNDGPLSDEDLRAIFAEVISACRRLQQPVSVGFLGPAGTYSEEAARKQLGSACRYVPYDSIAAVVRAAESDEVSLAIVPVENSIEGPVGQTLDALRSTPLTICNEVTLPIRHKLLSKAGNIVDVTEVAAHPQALAQCRNWLATHLPQAALRATSSNAEAARMAAETPELAAIAGASASQLYALPVLANAIADEPTNSTRFLILSRRPAGRSGSDMTSLLCSVPNEPGSLHRLMSVFAEAGINLTKLESRPVRNEPWQYIFYIDLDGHKDDQPVRRAIDRLKDHTASVKILGSYPKSR